MSSHNFRGQSSRGKKKPQKQMYRPVPRPVPSQKPPPTPPPPPPIKIRPAILFWDGDNCKIPTSQPPVSASDLPQNVLCLLKLFNISCRTLNVKLVGDMTQMAKVKSELSNVVKPTDIYNVLAAKTSPNASDYKLMALMVDWIQKNPNNPTTVIIASSDGDFARIANMIRQKNHLVVVLCHRRVSSQFLKGAADLVCDWQKVACGNLGSRTNVQIKELRMSPARFAGYFGYDRRNIYVWWEYSHCPLPYTMPSGLVNVMKLSMSFQDSFRRIACFGTIHFSVYVPMSFIAAAAASVDDQNLLLCLQHNNMTITSVVSGGVKTVEAAQLMMTDVLAAPDSLNSIHLLLGNSDYTILLDHTAPRSIFIGRTADASVSYPAGTRLWEWPELLLQDPPVAPTKVKPPS